MLTLADPGCRLHPRVAALALSQGIPMTRWILACACLLTVSSVAEMPAAAPCPQEHPHLVVPAVRPAFGSSPLWLSARPHLTWRGPRAAVPVIWIRDRSVPGLAVVSGRDRGSGARARFGNAGSTLRVREERYQIGWTGVRLRDVATADLRRFVFVPSDVWFPTPGCYEIVASVGLSKSVFVLNVERNR